MYGLQLSLIMHRWAFPGEEKLVKKHGKEEEVAALEEFIKSQPPRRMGLIGTTDGECETTQIYLRGAIHEVTVYND